MDRIEIAVAIAVIVFFAIVAIAFPAASIVTSRHERKLSNQAFFDGYIVLDGSLYMTERMPRNQPPDQRGRR